MTGPAVDGRNGKADADRTARRRQDGGVNADDLAVHVEQRAAGIALVDGRICLDIVVVGAGIDVAAACRDDAGRDRTAEAKRVADRHHPIAGTQLVGIAEFHRLQRLVALHLEHREIDLGILADDLRLQAVPSGKITLMSFASPITWLLVTTMPGGSITKPDPSEFERRWRWGAAFAPATAAMSLAAPVEELLEKVLERSAGRQLRQRAAPGLDGGRG